MDEMLKIDPWLGPFAEEIKRRRASVEPWKKQFEANEGGLIEFANSYKKYGLHANKDNKSIHYKEWAPNAVEAELVGEFNNWGQKGRYKMSKDMFGNFDIDLEPIDGEYAIPHDSKVKIRFRLPDGTTVDRLPAWITRATEPLKSNADKSYEARFWNPSEQDTYKFKNKRPKLGNEEGLKIYECHVGISSPEPKVSTYMEFTKNVLPRIKDLGYNTIQLMAIMEHAYYASFGYQITSFFAASSRYGTPEELKELVDTAHGMGITVLLDVVHSHASKNVLDGLNMYDGSDYQYFHGGPKGSHELWDSKLFNYGKYEVLRFLLSNLKFYLDVYQFDGFRFDGVTSMLYLHHGIGAGGAFSGSYNEYLAENGGSVDLEALTYLMLANDMVHEYGEKIDANLITIAEDVSGYPTLCLSSKIQGVGFDYRLSMAVPDMWIKIIKETQDEDWDMGKIVHTLTNRRYMEKCVTYCESHDQALVGDKTLAFWLMDKEMYTNMSDLTALTPVVDRGISLHKLIRLITHSLGGEAYLNFEGNEFGHPEWLDFPREGNNDSYQYARRQFNLVDDELLRYKYLYNFDKAMQTLESKYHWLSSSSCYISLKHEVDKVIVFEKGGLLFVFNFHPVNSYSDYRVGIDEPGCYKVVLNSDRKKDFCGHDRIDESCGYFTTDMEWNGRRNFLQIYIPNRTALVLAKE